MNILLNILWFVFTGFWTGILWELIALFCYITIIGIPFGKQCHKNAVMSYCPFGKEIIYEESNIPIIANGLWILLFGWELALTYVTSGLLWCVTIIGIPVGMQCFKLAQLSLIPFGAKIVERF